MKSKVLKTGQQVEFIAGNGRRFGGVVVNAAYYPGGQRAGKHYRIDVGGMIATIFANGPVGQSVEVVG